MATAFSSTLSRRAVVRGGLGLWLASALAPDASAARTNGLPIPLALDAPDGLDPAGWLVSEKYDGVRAVWDGQALRFRSGLPVAAPAWFTARLPAEPLDGELWLGRGRFEDLSGAVRRRVPDDAEWRALRFQVFELPLGPARLDDRLRALQALVQRQGFGQLQAVPQRSVEGRVDLQRLLDATVAAGGEGLVLRAADAPYAAGRTGSMLRLKPEQDDEAEVVAHLPGRGRLQGRLGALRVRDAAGQVFEIGTGFTDAQRDQPPAIGQRITYRFRGRTAAGVPRFASFLRERPAAI